MPALPFIYFAVTLAQAGSQAQTAQTTSPDQVKKGTISGTVSNAMTKEPLKRAEITLMPMRGQAGGAAMGVLGPMVQSGTRRVSADNDGKYTFTDVEAGRYSLIARRTGFLDGRYGARTPRGAGTQIEITGDQTVNNVKIELTPQAVISGRVVDEDGEPMQGQSVQVLRTQVQRAGGGRRMMGMGQQMTNDRGEFRIANVAPGTVYLQVSPGRFGPGGMSGGATETNKPDKQEVGYVTTFYPGTTDASQAAKVEVAAGADMSGFEFRLQKMPVFRVKGKIVDETTGQAPSNYFVNLAPKEGGFGGFFGQQFNRGADGTFELRGVAPGSYILNVQSGGGRGGPGGGGPPGPGGPGGIRMSHSEPLEVGTQNVEGVLIRIPAPVKVAGDVHRNTASKDLDISNFRLTLMPATQGFGGRPFQVKEDGTFESELISPGKYRVMTMGPSDSMWVESIKYGEQDVLGQEFEISGSPAPLHLVVGSDGGTISGTVMNSEDQPAPAASIVLIPEDKGRRAMQGGVRTAETNQNASFSFKNLAPGKYLVLALDQYDYGFWEDADALAKVAGKGATTEVAKQGAQSVTVKLTEMP